MTDPTKPALGLLCKLGSLIVHAEEAISADGSTLDLLALRALLKDTEVQAWIKSMGPLLPLKRKP